MDFDGFGIGGSFNKEDIGKAVRWVNEILPEEKPRHLLGIGEPGDLVEAIRNGCDTFDCVAPTRMARNGALHTKNGRINILNAKFKKDFGPIDTDCNCYTCKNYTKAYVAHLFRAEEMFAATLASIHNLAFVTKLVDEERRKILEG
jgi:queuine tRNA-ribosyltransferase